jgi:hypothetical protein
LAEIIQFPGFDERAWKNAEPEWRVGLLKAGCAPSIIDWVFADVKPRVLSVKTSHTLGPYDGISPEAVARIGADFQRAFGETATALIGQLLLIEVELYHARAGR